MITGWITSASIPSIFLGTVVLALMACEAGFLIGRRRARLSKETPDSISAMVAGLLSMLAFILALIFSITVSQFQTRNQNVVTEAAAVQSAYLLADLVATPQKLEMKRQLRRYIQVRLQVIQDRDLQTALSQSHEIYQLLWVHATAAAENKPDDITSMVVQSIIEVISQGEQRKVAAVHSQIPENVWYGLLVITLLSMVMLGLQLGFYGKRRLVAVLPLNIAFAVLIALVVDLDRPQRGFITVSQQAMVDVQIIMGTIDAAP
ncbi:bestrophin-like domain [Oceanisphaera sp. W20_SRM_FM3]|uniref:bestrophin-like domain n=1 Tax=Oceanisphaera sp. W20_SRM_FM3 TaxID=3240267 RepID=UPI003F94A7B0